jgi:hypothetical protein
VTDGRVFPGSLQKAKQAGLSVVSQYFSSLRKFKEALNLKAHKKTSPSFTNTGFWVYT